MYRALLLFLFFAPCIDAVEISGSGTGQYLIYPYFDVSGTQQAFLTVENKGPGAALKLRLIDGDTGDAFWTLNLYLGSFDIWTAAVMSDDTGQLVVRTRDPSCAVPQGSQVDGVMQFDTGIPTARGIIEVVEMGVLTNNMQHSALAAEHVGPEGSSLPIDCNQLNDAWSESGYWNLDNSTDMDSPRGQLSGELSTISVPDGTVHSYQAVALANYTHTAKHTDPESARPDLRDANSDTDDGSVISVVETGQKRTVDLWAEPIDAVNAALIGHAFQGRFVAQDSIGAKTDVHIALPTWAFRFKEEGVPRPPFEAPGRFTDGAQLGYDAYGPGGSPFGGFVECEPGPCRSQSLQGVGALTTLRIDPDGRYRTHDRIATGGIDSGYLVVNSYGARAPFLNEASGNVYVGAPAIMLIQRAYSNGQIRDEAGNTVRANYSDVLSMRRTIRIEEPIDPDE